MSTTKTTIAAAVKDTHHTLAGSLLFVFAEEE